MEIKVDPEAINKYMAEKLIESTIGSQLKVAITQELERHTKGYGDNLTRSAVNRFIGDQIEAMLSTEFQEAIKAAIRKQITGVKIDELAAKFVDNLDIKGRY